MTKADWCAIGELANTVTITSAARNYLERSAAEQKAEGRFGGEVRPINLYGWRGRFRQAYLNFALQTAVTLCALLSLQERQGLVSPWIVTVAIACSFVLIASQAARAMQDSVAIWRARR